MVQAAGVISGIGAVASNGMLGLDNWLPWDIPEELAYFERTVQGAALLIGRLTYESMDVVPSDAFIVTSRPDYPVRPGCVAVGSVEEGLRRALATGKPVFVIGGASVYAAAAPYCQHFFLTRIERDFSGDTLFPEAALRTGWRLCEERSEMLWERKRGEMLTCRFLHYLQDSPRPVPTGD